MPGRDLRRWLTSYFFAVFLAGGICYCPDSIANTAQLQSIDARLKAIEDAEYDDFDDITAELAEMAPLIKDAPQALQSRHARLQCWYFDGTPNQGIALANKQLSAAIAKQQAAAVVDFQLCRGFYHYVADDYPTALDDYNQGMEAARKLQDIRLIADAAYLRGELYGVTGELALSLADFITAQNHYKEYGVEYWIYTNLVELANTYRRLGDQRKALELYFELQRTPYFRDSKYNQVENYQYIALAYEDLKQPEKAYEFYLQAHELTLGLDDADMLAGSHFYLGGVLSQLGKYRKAIDHLDRSITPRAWEDKGGMEITNLLYAEAFSGLGRYEEALAKATQAEQFFTRVNNLKHLNGSQKLLAEILAKTGRWQQAYQKLNEHLESKAELHKRTRQQQSLRMQAEFESERKAAETELWQAERAYLDKQMAALEQAQHWRNIVIIMGFMLLALAATLGVRQMSRARHYNRLAHTDEFTGLPNRRHILRLARRQLSQAKQARQPFCLALFDIDHFKSVNDNHGHDKGDRILQQLARKGQTALRRMDNLGRTGGEEFLVVLPNTQLWQAKAVAERIRQTIEDTRCGDITEPLTVTVSIGVAQLSDCDQSLEQLISRADRALYQAKDNGRNRVELGQTAQQGAA